MPSSLIIGAGMAGLTAARALTRNGWDVVVLDKGRSVGGRMATRRLEQARLDHGAQYFTAQTPAFQRVVESLLTENVVAQWPSGKTYPTSTDPDQPRYVGTEGMNTVAKALARGLTVLTEQTVTTCRAEPTGWLVETGLGRQFRTNTLIVTLPAPQVLALMAQSSLAMTAADRLALATISYQPCIAVLVALNRPVSLPEGGFCPATGDVAWVMDNAQKGISPSQPSLTIHAGAPFSRAHINDDELTGAGQVLIDQLRNWMPADAVSAVQVHRWRYSLAEQRHPNPFLAAQAPFPLLFGGDGFGAGNVEGAFTSGLAMAEFLQGLAVAMPDRLT